MKLGEAAKNFQPAVTLNVADLEKFSIDFEVHTETATNSEGKEFSYNYFDFNDQKYRIPNPVMEKVQDILKLRPEAKWFKATKTGSGVSTKYKVDIVE